MDEMRIKLTTNFMKGIASKLIARSIKKKYGYKVNVDIKDLDIWSIDGDTSISTNVEIKMNSSEFNKLMKTIGMD